MTFGRADLFGAPRKAGFGTVRMTECRGMFPIPLARFDIFDPDIRYLAGSFFFLQPLNTVAIVRVPGKGPEVLILRYPDPAKSRPSTKWKLQKYAIC